MIMPHIKFRRVVTSGEGTKSQSGQGSQSSVESVVFDFFQLGGKFMGSSHGIISCTFSCAWNRSLKMQGVPKESWGLCWEWGGVTGNTSGEESLWLLSSLSCSQVPF